MHWPLLTPRSLTLLVCDSFRNACHVRALALTVEKHYQKCGCGHWEGSERRKDKYEVQVGGRIDFIFLTHWDRFQQITDKEKTHRKKRLRKEKKGSSGFERINSINGK